MFSGSKKLDPKSVQLFRNVALSFIIKGIALLVTFYTLPALIHYFQNRTVLGMWFTAVSVLGWVLTLDLGIGNGLRNYLVEPLMKDNFEEVKVYVSSAYTAVGIVVVILFGIGALVVPMVNWNSVLNVPSDIVDEHTVKTMVTILLASIFLQFWLKLVVSIVYAMQKSFVPAMITLVTSAVIMIFASFIEIKRISDSVVVLSYVYLVATNMPYVIVSIVLFMTRLRKCIPDIRYYRYSYAIRTIKMGGVFFYLQMLTVLMFGTNEYLISSLACPSDVVLYQVYNRIFSLISSAFYVALTPIWSGVTEACVQNDYSWIIKVYRKLCMMVPFVILLEIVVVFYMPTISHVWLRNNYINTQIIYAVIFAIYNTLFIIVGIYTNIIAGMGRLRVQTCVFTVCVILKILLAITMVTYSRLWVAVVVADICAIVPYILIEYQDIHKRLYKKAGNNT